MAQRPTSSRPPLPDRSRHAEKAASGSLFFLLRYSHIFASVVRQILEEKLLGEIASEPLTLSQLHLMKLIALDGHHQVGEVADFLGVSPPAASKNIDKLERMGLVIRRPSTTDRRATVLYPSSKGRLLVAKYENLTLDRVQPILDEFTVEEVDELAHLLERFSTHLLRQEEDGNGVCLRCDAYFDAHCPILQLRKVCPYQRIRRSHKGRTSPVDGDDTRH